MSDSDLLRQARRMSLLTYGEAAMPMMIPEYQAFPYNDLILAKIEEQIAPRRFGRLAINLPPRHGKSFLLVTAATWFLGRYPEREVLLVAHSQSLASDLAGKVGQLMQSSLFTGVFPEFQLMQGREATADFRTTRGGGFKAAGLDTGLTGRGFDVMFIDDALSAQDANSGTARQFVRNVYDNMLATRPNDPGTSAIVSMSHRLHEDDLTGHLLKLGYDHLKLPFQATEDESFACRGVEFKRKAGDVLQPGRFSVDDVRKAGVTSQVYATQYQQAPIAVGSGILSERNFPTVETCPSAGQTIVSWDTASSTREGASYSVALVFQVTSDVAYLKHIMRGRFDYPTLKKRALDLHATFKPSLHLVEAASLGISLASELREGGANVIDIKPGPQSKEERLNAVLIRLNANFVRPVASIPNLREFMNECTAFPHGSNDDMVDALTQFLKWLQEHEPKPAPVLQMRILKPLRNTRFDLARKMTGQR